MSTDLQATIEAAWDARDTLGLTTTGAVRDAVENFFEPMRLSRGRLCYCGRERGSSRVLRLPRRQLYLVVMVEASES